MSALAWLLLLAGWGCALDAARRPASSWTAADRQKGFWVAGLIILAPVFLLGYLIGVLPRFLATTSPSDAANPFRKQP